MKWNRPALVKKIVVLLGLAPVAALASPGAGVLFNVLVSQGTTTEGIHDVGHLGRWNSVLFTNGPTLFRTTDFALAPGGYGGWHSHPGPVLITVKRGTIAWYDGNCRRTLYAAGSAYIEPAGAVHNPRNETATEDAEAFATFIAPVGVPLRQEEEPPAACPNLP